MARYRKRPVVIEAEQIEFGKPLPSHVEQDDDGLYIDTLEGKHRVAIGYWRIIGVKGEAYGCEAGIFEATYEPA